MRLCSRCTLSDRVFSVKIDDAGRCNYCTEETKPSLTRDARQASADDALKDVFKQTGDRPYQVLLAYSGGKDSTYTLLKLRQTFGASVLAVTFDNGFLTAQCRENISTVTAHLHVDSMTIKPSFPELAQIFKLAASQEIFPKKALERASSICTACIGLVKAAVWREAILRQIPFVCFGWTPGQAPVKSPVLTLDVRMLLANQKQIEEPIVKNLGDTYKKYFLDAAWALSHGADIPAQLYPLVFEQYDEDRIFKTIERIGWRRPSETDMNSTNCLLNSYANAVHYRQYGFHPYCFEIAGLVRHGFLTREEGLKKLSSEGDEAVIQAVKRQLDTDASV
ncbi:hypothetical protein AAFA46_06865 [Oscillospiraceae bacterium WX1]